MSDNDPSLPSQRSLYRMLEDMLPHMRVQSTERIVQKYDIKRIVERTSDVDPLLLASRQADSLFSDFGGVAIREHVEIGHEGRVFDDFPVALLLEISAEQDVIAD